MSRPSTNDNKPTSLFQDSVFATLMDMFGDTVAPDVIQGVGSTRQWNRKLEQQQNSVNCNFHNGFCTF